MAPSRVGSVVGGGFRVVSVRYPRGRGPGAAGRLMLALVGAALLAGAWPRLGDLGPAFYVVWTVMAAGLFHVGLRSTVDLVAPTRVSGVVLARSPTRASRRGLTHAVVIDDGRHGTVTAWLATRAVAGDCRPGRVVDLRGRPWTRRLVGPTSG